GNKSPCAILLHAIGENRQKDGWDELATALKGQGISVLTLDFRGHGESTDIGPSFWSEPRKLTLKNAKSTRTRDKISYKDFSQIDHYKMLVNDIAAAKHFLDTKNDSGECNSANTIIIGAEQGAALGALWIYHAFNSQRTTPGILGVQVPTRQIEGEDVACAIWLSMSSSVGPNQNTSKVNVANWMPTPIRDKVPMLFLYGKEDSKSAQYSKTLCENVLGAKGTNKNLKLTMHKGIEGTKLAGRELLGVTVGASDAKAPAAKDAKPMKTQDWIVEYITKVLN